MFLNLLVTKVQLIESRVKLALDWQSISFNELNPLTKVINHLNVSESYLLFLNRINLKRSIRNDLTNWPIAGSIVKKWWIINVKRGKNRKLKSRERSLINAVTKSKIATRIKHWSLFFNRRRIKEKKKERRLDFGDSRTKSCNTFLIM